MELRINYIIVDEKNRWLSTGFESTIEEIEEDIKEIKQDLKNKGELTANKIFNNITQK